VGSRGGRGGAACLVFGFDPGLFRIDVFVGGIGQFHDVAHCLAVFAPLVGISDVIGFGGDAVEEGGVGQRVRQLVGEVFFEEGRTAAGEIDELADEVAVVFLAEVVEVEIEVFDARAQFGSVVVAQVFRRQVFEVGLGFDEGAARFAHFFAVHGEEAVAVHAARLAVARAFEHGRPEEHMEVGDVFADEVVELGVAAGCRCGFLRAGVGHDEKGIE